MSNSEIHKRIKRIVGEYPKEAIFSLDSGTHIVKPNSFSHSGMLLNGKLLSPISYGSLSVLPVSMTLGLNDHQIDAVLDHCLMEVKHLKNLVGVPYLAKKEANHILEELVVCFNTKRQASDNTFADVLKRFTLPQRKKILQIFRGMKIEGYNIKSELANRIYGLHVYVGDFAKEYLKENQRELISRARKSFIPYLTHSTYEQDHYGIGKMIPQDVPGQNDYETRRSQIDYSPIYFGGIDTLADRMDVEITAPKDKKQIDPIKKKKLFLKADKTMRYLEKTDDPHMLESFGKMMGYLGGCSCKGCQDPSCDCIDFNRLLPLPQSIEVETPFVVPIIAEEEEDLMVPVSYAPLDALDLLTQKMAPSDYLGSTNTKNKNKPFPFGGLAPLAKPKRVKSEVK